MVCCRKGVSSVFYYPNSLLDERAREELYVVGMRSVPGRGEI